MKKMKDKKFAFRVSESDLNKIRTQAKKARMTVTDYLVTSALNHPINIIEGVDELAKELKPIGNNINQLTTLAHMGKCPGDLLEVYDVNVVSNGDSLLTTLTQFERFCAAILDFGELLEK